MLFLCGDVEACPFSQGRFAANGDSSGLGVELFFVSACSAVHLCGQYSIT
jgi:hypothetical protein